MFKIMTKKAYQKLIDEMDYLVKRREIVEKANERLLSEKMDRECRCVEGTYCHICKNHFNYKEDIINRFGDHIFLNKIGCKCAAKCNSFVDNTVVKIN